jgi:hypothetical protein
MTTTKKASKAGARRVTANLDVLASLFQNHHRSLGIPQKVAMDFAYRCDLLSDSIDRRKQAGYFDPSQIGKEVPGPLVYDENNPFMEGEFTREEFRALDEKQMAGELAANAAAHVADPKLASVIRKAAYSAALAALRTAKKSEEAKAEEAEETTAEEAKAEEAKAEEAKAEKLARARRAAQALRQAKKSEEAEEQTAEEADEAKAEEAKKSASAFGLFR